MAMGAGKWFNDSKGFGFITLITVVRIYSRLLGSRHVRIQDAHKVKSNV